MPDTANKNQENASGMRTRLLSGDLMELVRDDPAGFRLLSVSMCDHDIYADGDFPDPNNPGTIPKWTAELTLERASAPGRGLLAPWGSRTTTQGQHQHDPDPGRAAGVLRGRRAG